MNCFLRLRESCAERLLAARLICFLLSLTPSDSPPIEHTSSPGNGAMAVCLLPPPLQGEERPLIPAVLSVLKEDTVPLGGGMDAEVFVDEDGPAAAAAGGGNT